MASTQNISPHCVSFSPKTSESNSVATTQNISPHCVSFSPKPLRVTAWPALKTLALIVLVFPNTMQANVLSAGHAVTKRFGQL